MLQYFEQFAARRKRLEGSICTLYDSVAVDVCSACVGGTATGAAACGLADLNKSSNICFHTLTYFNLMLLIEEQNIRTTKNEVRQN